MDKSERETRDFMSVESFSQLPFIRPPPLASKEKGGGGGGGGAIRLFGKEFELNSIPRDADDFSANSNNARELGEANKDHHSDNNAEISSRKFECHYCCRHFPTSQALGGHQNAHKRERQHAKRAHLQSAMVNGGLSDAQDYGLMNYSRYGSAPVPYHSWNGSYSGGATTRLYTTHGSYNSYQTTQPINGSPLAMWRIPTSGHNSSTFGRDQRVSVANLHPQTPLFSSRDDDLKPLSAIRSGLNSSKATNMQDHVSLDLHL